MWNGTVSQRRKFCKRSKLNTYYATRKEKKVKKKNSKHKAAVWWCLACRLFKSTATTWKCCWLKSLSFLSIFYRIHLGRQTFNCIRLVTNTSRHNERKHNEFHFRLCEQNFSNIKWKLLGKGGKCLCLWYVVPSIGEKISHVRNISPKFEHHPHPPHRSVRAVGARVCGVSVWCVRVYRKPFCISVFHFSVDRTWAL